MKVRKAKIRRKTKETDIEMALNIDKSSPVEISTGIPFFDHMLNAFACHGRFSLVVKAKGDLEVDPHHLVEDCGITLGNTFAKALGGFHGIARAGCFGFPMDESLASVAVDLCNRTNLVWKVKLGDSPISGFDPRLFREFCKGMADGMRATMHIVVPWKDNDHHAVEAVAKALGRALKMACEPLGSGKVLSTKGSLNV